MFTSRTIPIFVRHHLLARPGYYAATLEKGAVWIKPFNEKFGEGKTTLQIHYSGGTPGLMISLVFDVLNALSPFVHERIDFGHLFNFILDE